MQLKRIAAFIVLTSSSIIAQTTQPLGQTFHAPKADVEQALRDLNAYQSGKLPFLEGFVGQVDAPLANYQRAYYQYTITVLQKSDSEVTVAANAKISAWYEDHDPSKSGYRDLPSSGRLEEDLLDRLRVQLRKNAAEAEASQSPLVSRRLLGLPEQPQPDAPASTPEAPGVPASSTPSFRSVAPSAAASAAEKPPTSAADDARFQRLLNEENILNTVLASQQHPQDLVAVKNPHTRIVAMPSDSAKVLMFADAEDEFQLLKTEGEWVHIQIAGLNRGWVRRSQLDMPGTGDLSTTASASAPEPFKQTKEETSKFPGDWAPLRGKSVRIIWVQPNGKSTQESRLSYAESVFKKEAPRLASGKGVDGVVIVFDAVEGGMAATTLATLQQWGSGAISDAAFLKQCWFDPEEAFAVSASR